ncbi:MAG: hypothetical protein KGO05_09315 [Chloroflexota bacterium]|nr:hypothetical protein [Chloroflexota bacterium]
MSARDLTETKEYHLIYAELIHAARHRGTVTYQEVAELIGIQTYGSYMGHEIGAYAGVISMNEVRHGRPMLSAILVRVDGVPSGGFFDLARQLGRLNSDDEAHQQAFLAAETQAVYHTWKRTFDLPPHQRQHAQP